MQELTQKLWPGFWALILCAVFTASLFYQGLDSVLIAPVLMGLLIFSLGATLIPGILHGFQVSTSATFTLVFLYWAYLAITPFWSTIPYNSVLFVYIMSGLPLVFFAMVLAPDPKRLANYCMAGFAVTLLGLAVWALVQFFFFFEEYGPRIHHPMLDPNNLGALFVMGFIGGLALFLRAEKLLHILLAGVLIFMFLGGLVATHSRGGQLSGIIAAIALLAMLGPKAPHLWMKIAYTLTLGFILYLVFNFITGGDISKSFEKVVVLFTHDPSIAGRLELWSSTWEIIKEHPIWGTGLGTFYHFYPEKRDLKEISDGFFAHNDPLQFWAEMGVAAPIIIYTLFVAVLLRTLKAFKALPPESWERTAIAASFCALLSVAVHIHTNFMLYVLPLLFPIGVLLAFWYVATETALGASRRAVYVAKDLRAPAFIGLALACGFVVLWIVQSSVSVWYLKEAGVAFSREDVPAAKIAVEEAQRWAPRSNDRVYESLGRLRLYQLKGSQGSAAEREKLLQEGLAALEKAQTLSPRSSSSHNYTAMLYYLGFQQGLLPDGDEKALVVLDEILQHDPIFVAARMGQSTIYRGRNDYEEALKKLEAGLPWPRAKSVATIEYFVELYNVRTKLGDEEGAQWALEQAKDMNVQRQVYMAEKR